LKLSLWSDAKGGCIEILNRDHGKINFVHLLPLTPPAVLKLSRVEV